MIFNNKCFKALYLENPLIIMTVSDGAGGPVIVCHGGVNWHHVGAGMLKHKLMDLKHIFVMPLE